jgi:hypothetical protein
MVNLGELFETQEVDCPEWDKTKDTVKSSIDACLEKGSVDKEVLLIMKELLEYTKPSMSELVED